MGEFLSYLIPALITVVIGLIDRHNNKEKQKLEVEKLRLEIDNERAEKQVLAKHKEETDIKLDFLNRIMDLEFINSISEAVNRVFEVTKSDRFLILVARNGKSDFNVVSVVFEAHKKSEYRINAIARYRNVHIDNEYREMLKEVEFKGVIRLKTDDMKESVLKDFYETEGVKYSKIRHLARKPIDDGNDFLVYSSLSTHENRDFTRKELSFIKTQYEGTIIPSINKIFD